MKKLISGFFIKLKDKLMRFPKLQALNSKRLND